MIITALHSENILKYAHFDLEEIPELGIIAISGANESGKTSIGETICFALFGRTFSHTSLNIQKIIRWGAGHGSVTLNFRQGKNNYRLTRLLDNDGNHSVKLISLENQSPPVTGVTDVTTALNNLLGFDFDDFVSSFYLAQREITVPNPRSATVKIMAGIAPLELVMKEIAGEITREEQEAITAEQRVNEIQSDINDLAFDKTRLRTLRKQHTSDKDTLTEIQRHTKGIEQADRRYQEAALSIVKLNYFYALTQFIRDLVFLLIVIIGSGWVLLAYFPDHYLAQQIDVYRHSYFPVDQYSEYSDLVVIGSALSVVLFFWGMNFLLRKRIQHLSDARINLAAMLRKIYHSVTAYCSHEGNLDSPLLEIEYPADNEEIDQIAQRMINNQAPVHEVNGIITRTHAWLMTLAHQYEKVVSGLDAAIIREEDRHHKVEQLEGMSQKFQTAIDEHRRRISVRQVATELLQGACGRIIQRFNYEVRDLVGMTLPLFTDGHYQYLRIDPDLNVRIFSKEKHDFMDIDEVSSGTQRQTMLALRISLARQLLERTRGMPQFIFLDEPFAFFDEQRTRQTLAVLPQLNPKLSQIWIIAQSFSEETKSSFALHVHCSRDGENCQKISN